MSLFSSPFLAKPRKTHIPVTLVAEKNYDSWLAAQSAQVKALCNESGFNPKNAQTLPVRDKAGRLERVFAGVRSPVDVYDLAKSVAYLRKALSSDFLKDASFEIQADGFSQEDVTQAHIGWGLGCYKFESYKNNKSTSPSLVIAKSANKKRIQGFVESIFLTRNLVNIPANDMGPDELEKAAADLASRHKQEISVIRDKDLLRKNFPMIFEVGKASVRRPRLLDFYWGNPKHPKVTLVGKGVCFDTGGLDIKTSQYMLTMKKDMGGAAHVLGLAHLIMTLKLPVRLRVLIPAVENAIDGNAYRPSDILKSRKGMTVEVGNTDAEGRLVLADAIAYACEEKPELIVDFATLTGAARVALGYDIPALFTNREKIADEIKALSAQPEVGESVWPLPLWAPYRKDMDSSVADISSTGKGPAGATTAALFLKEFVDETIEWVHMDVYAWEQNGKAGRPQGGADTGLRAIFAWLEKRYGQ